MSSKTPLTIDNLGIDTSRRYARDKEALDTKLLEESRFIPQKTEISVLKPYITTEFEEYLLPEKTAIWASFAPPPDYVAYTKSLFSYQLIPSLGSYEKQEADSDKLEALEDVLQKESKGGKQDSRDNQEKEKERKTIVALLQCIGKLDRVLSLINSRRNQYQRG